MALNDGGPAIGSGRVVKFDPLAIRPNRWDPAETDPNQLSAREQFAALNDANSAMNPGGQPFSQAYNAFNQGQSGSLSPIYTFNNQPVQAAGYGAGDSAAVSGTTATSRYSNDLGKYLYEREDPDPTSAYTQCYYRSETEGQPDVMRLCEKITGCCDEDCCPKDYQRLGGLYVLIVFVVIFAVVGFIIAGVCLVRSRSRKKREQKEYNDGYASSAMGSQAGYPYASSAYGAPGKY